MLYEYNFSSIFIELKYSGGLNILLNKINSSNDTVFVVYSINLYKI